MTRAAIVRFAQALAGAHDAVVAACHVDVTRRLAGDAAPPALADADPPLGNGFGLVVRAQTWFNGKVPYVGGGMLADVAPQHRLSDSNPTSRMKRGSHGYKAILRATGPADSCSTLTAR